MPTSQRNNCTKPFHQNQKSFHCASHTRVLTSLQHLPATKIEGCYSCMSSRKLNGSQNFISLKLELGMTDSGSRAQEVGTARGLQRIR